MKILLVFPQEDGQTGLSIKRAFLALGHEVYCFDPKKESHNNLFSVFMSIKPEVVFCSRTPGLALPVHRMKIAWPIAKFVCWNVDKRDSVVSFGQPLLDLFNAVDVFYTIAEGNIPEYKQILTRTRVLHLQQGCDPETHHPEELTAADHEKYDCDVMFAGTQNSKFHHGRAEMVLGLSKMCKEKNWKLRLFGDRSPKIYDAEHNKACQCAKICIGHNGWPQLAVSMSVRAYKVMAAGGFLLEEWCPGIDEWFEGINDYYKTNLGLIQLIEYYLANEHERKAKAAAGMELVHKKHRYLDRIQRVMGEI